MDSIDRHGTFVQVQEEALLTDEIVDAWYAAQDESGMMYQEYNIQVLRDAVEDVDDEVTEQSRQVADKIEADYNRLHARFREAMKMWMQEREAALLLRTQKLKTVGANAFEIFTAETKLKILVDYVNGPNNNLPELLVEKVTEVDQELDSIEALFPELAADEPIEDAEPEVFDEETEAMLTQAEESRSHCAN